MRRVEGTRSTRRHTQELANGCAQYPTVDSACTDMNHVTHPKITNMRKGVAARAGVAGCGVHPRPFTGALRVRTLVSSMSACAGCSNDYSKHSKERISRSVLLLVEQGLDGHGDRKHTNTNGESRHGAAEIGVSVDACTARRDDQ